MESHSPRKKKEEEEEEEQGKARKTSTEYANPVAITLFAKETPLQTPIAVTVGRQLDSLAGADRLGRRRDVDAKTGTKRMTD